MVGHAVADGFATTCAGLPVLLSGTVTRQEPSASTYGRACCVSGEERSGCSTPEVAIVFAPPPEPKPDTGPMSPAEAALRTRIDALDLAPSAGLTAAHPAVLRTAVRLKHLKSHDLTWPRGTRSGPIIEVRNVSAAHQDRALMVLDALLRGAEKLDWSFEPPPPDPNADRRQSFARSTVRPPVYGRLIVDGEPLQLRIGERQRQSDHVPTDQEKTDKKRGRYVWMPRFDYAPSGELRLQVTEPGHSYTEKVWKDTKAHPLEVQVCKILHRLLNLALERKRHREEQRQREIEARELERQHAIVRERRAANIQLIEELERQAGAWHRARFLRRYLRAAKRALDDRLFTVDLQGQPTDFIRWAEHYVNQLDPLHPEPRNPEFAHERSWQYGSEEKRVTDELQRLFGHTWEEAT